MDLKVAFVIVCLCALAITSTEGSIPKCCITTRRTIPRRVLRKVLRWEVQLSSGPCDISALVLRVKGLKKIICAHPSVKTTLAKMKQKAIH